jgi:formylglycine-generating enzyme
MCETEISNAQYMEFIKDLQHNDTQAARENYPDTFVWRSANGYNEPFVEHYLNHPIYRDYPVVGITQKQAMNYCNWARMKILETYKREKYPIKDILVRLPTQKEWEMAARGGLDQSAIYPWLGDDFRMHNDKKRNNGKFRLNTWYTKTTVTGGVLLDAGFVTVPIYAYWPNGFGLYNMCGNVAEWVLETGKNKGGSWNDDPYQCRIDVPGKYDGNTMPRSTIGFRYVVEIVEMETMQIGLDKLNAKTIEKEFAKTNPSEQIEKGFTKTDSNLFAGITEVTNAWYQTFIQKSGLNQYNPNDTLWLQKDKYKYHLMYSKNAIFKDYPVVNITHEAATKYCEWLTQYYNQLPKRKYKKVVFELPDEGDWEHAAKGGIFGRQYPWRGPYLQNSQGKYLANHNPIPYAYIENSMEGLKDRIVHPYDSSVSRKVDGWEFTCPVKSYFPNDYGLYNVSGNASEMLDSMGLSVGGSWNSEAHYLQIGYYRNPQDIFQSYIPENGHYRIYEKQSGPSPTLGFRVFMEVIEEFN